LRKLLKCQDAHRMETFWLFDFLMMVEEGKIVKVCRNDGDISQESHQPPE
jgi:hypothetical protein